MSQASSLQRFQTTLGSLRSSDSMVVERCTRTAQSTAIALERVDQALNPVAGQDGDGADHRRRQHQERLRDPAQTPARLAFGHVPVMRDLPVPFGVKLLHRDARRMIYHHLGNVAKAKVGRARALAPVHVFGHVDAGEGADALKIAPKHREVARTGVAVLFDVELESISEYALIGFDRIEARLVGTPNADVAAKNCRRRGRREWLVTRLCSQSGCARQSASMNARISPCAAATPVLRAGPGPGLHLLSRHAPG